MLVTHFKRGKLLHEVLSFENVPERNRTTGKPGPIGLVRQRGSSLVEILVSLVLASVGLLALAGVSATATRYSKMSQYRATATLLATDIGERMRANKAGFRLNGYEFTDDFSTQVATPTLPSEKCDAASPLACTAVQMAAIDIAQWRLIVRRQLPAGTVFLKRDGVTDSLDLWISWADPAVANADEQPVAANECSNDLNIGDVEPEEYRRAIRCVYFRVNL